MSIFENLKSDIFFSFKSTYMAICLHSISTGSYLAVPGASFYSGTRFSGKGGGPIAEWRVERGGAQLRTAAARGGGGGDPTEDEEEVAE